MLQRVRPVILPIKTMLVTVFCAPRDRPEITFDLDVSPDLVLRDFVGLCVTESGIPADEIQVTQSTNVAVANMTANGAKCHLATMLTRA